MSVMIQSQQLSRAGDGLMRHAHSRALLITGASVKRTGQSTFSSHSAPSAFDREKIKRVGCRLPAIPAAAHCSPVNRVMARRDLEDHEKEIVV